MKKTSYSRKHKEALDAILGEISGVKSGMMFGLPAYYVDGKLFACVYGDGVGVKLPESLAEQLLKEDNVVPFQPMGRPRMKEWIQLNRAISSDYEKDRETFVASVSYVSSLGKKRRKG